MRHFLLTLALGMSLFVSNSADAAEKLKLLIIDGQNNHK